MSRTGVALDNNGIVMPTCLLIRVSCFIRVPDYCPGERPTWTRKLAEVVAASRSTVGDYNCSYSFNV